MTVLPDASVEDRLPLAEPSAPEPVEPPAASGARRRLADAWIPLLFLGSGAAGLIYQVVWTRDLVLVFGNTTQAIVTTVTAFLAGLGIGSLVGAWVGMRVRRPLALYGLVELVVAGLALLMPLAFDAVATLFRSAYLSLPAGEVVLIRFVLSFCALAPVTICMGMTLPLLTRYLVRTERDVGNRIARLYGLNTLGAAAGAAASGFVLIGVLGLRETTHVAVALNSAAGLGALLISGVTAAGRTSPPVERRAAQPGDRTLSTRQIVLLGVTFASGLISLAVEILWTRVLLQGTGSSIYIFASVLTMFLLGIAIGSLVYEHLKDRAATMSTLGLCFAAVAVLAIVPVIVSDIKGPPGLSIVIPLLLPVTAILGYTFPLTVRLFVDNAANASRGVGVVYASNRAGCVVGTVVAGFVLGPLLGANMSIIALSLLLVAIGAALVLFVAFRKHWIRNGLAIALAAAVIVTLFVPQARLSHWQLTMAGSRIPHATFNDSIAQVNVIGGPPSIGAC
jgi:spermidine synthase